MQLLKKKTETFYVAFKATDGRAKVEFAELGAEDAEAIVRIGTVCVASGATIDAESGEISFPAELEMSAVDVPVRYTGKKQTDEPAASDDDDDDDDE